MNGASVIVVPGSPGLMPSGPEPYLEAVLPIVLPAMGAVAAWYAWRGRRRRVQDPRELAFRRMVQAMGLGRREVRALRREAAERGLASPVGLAFSPVLIEQAVRRHARSR